MELMKTPFTADHSARMALPRAGKAGNPQSSRGLDCFAGAVRSPVLKGAAGGRVVNELANHPSNGEGICRMEADVKTQRAGIGWRVAFPRGVERDFKVGLEEKSGNSGKKAGND